MLPLIFFASTTNAIPPKRPGVYFSCPSIPPSLSLQFNCYLSPSGSLLSTALLTIPRASGLCLVWSIPCTATIRIIFKPCPDHSLLISKHFCPNSPNNQSPVELANLIFHSPPIYAVQEDYFLPPHVWPSVCVSQPLSFCSCHSFFLWAPTVNSIYLIAFMFIHVFQELECVGYFCY